ncbi:MAG: methyltransferase RsmF C-terminal domain-like protein [Dysgonomonas sp.]
MNLPIDFITRTKTLLGKEWDIFCTALNEVPPISIRLNKEKVSDNTNILPNIPWYNNGYYLNERPQFTFDPLFHAGCYYVQEASSMFIGQVLKQYIGNNIRILDLCAAPGGKSTLIADMIDEDSLLVSNEVIRSRSNILAENIIKWGKPNIIVTNNDPKQIGKLNGFFDIILVDAPCSGEGMFRKDENAIKEWSVENVKLCRERQQRILADIWPALKEEGILIYSTCTYNRDENEENVIWMRDELGAQVLPVETKEEWNISPSIVEEIAAYRFFPHKTKGEGFFCAVLRKSSEDAITESRRKIKSNKDNKKKINLPAEYKEYLLSKDDFMFYPKGESWHAIPKHLYEDTYLIGSLLNTVSEGICLGEFKGKDFIPDQSLAYSCNLNKDAFPKYDADWKTAIAYLRKEALVLPDTPKGYILLTYKGMSLGFVKNIGNRANNLYPPEWRIRSTNIPNDIVSVI